MHLIDATNTMSRVTVCPNYMDWYVYNVMGDITEWNMNVGIDTWGNCDSEQATVQKYMMRVKDAWKIVMVGVQDEMSLMLKDFAEDSAVMPQKNSMIVMVLQHSGRCGSWDRSRLDRGKNCRCYCITSFLCVSFAISVPPGSVTHTRGQ